MKMKKAIMLFLTVLLTAAFFMGCEDAAGTTTYTLAADDGFGLVSSTLPFNSSTSVTTFTSAVDPDSTTLFYAPTNLRSLEDGDAPVISFTFNENLRSSALEAVFRIDEENGAYSYGDINEGIFYYTNASGSDLTSTDVSVSGATVSFTFDADTFDIDTNYFVEFGVVSSKGEYYQVFTAFQPQADITAPVELKADFSGFFSYAVDSTGIYTLALATEETHTDEALDAEKVLGTTTNDYAGKDFGTAINDLSKRATNDPADDSDVRTYDNLLEVYTNGTYLDYIPLTVTHDDYKYTTEYNFFYENEDGSSYGPLTAFSTGYVYEDENADDLVKIGETYEVYIYDDGWKIQDGDKIYCTPSNSRGYFGDMSDVYTFDDTVHPFRKDALTMSDDAGMSWTGINYNVLDDEHDTATAAAEGHLNACGTWSVTSLDGWNDSEDHEDYVYELTASNMSVAYDGTTDGKRKVWTEAAVRKELSLADDVALFNSDNSYVWSYMIGSTLYVYAGFECYDNGTKTSYDYSGETWETTGKITVKVTDKSGNSLFYRHGTTNESDGILENITLN